MEDRDIKMEEYREKIVNGEYPFVDLKRDVAFKAVFGKPGNEDLLLMLLDALLPEKHIVKVELGSQEQMPDRIDQQRAIYDINCMTNDGTSITVEMQFLRQADFADRMIYYSGFTARNRVGEFPGLHYRLPQIYVIGILNFIMPGLENNRVINHYAVCNRKDGTMLSDSMNYVTVELPKFTKGIDALKTKLDRLLYLMRHLEYMKCIPDKLCGKNLDKLFSVAKFAAMDAQTQEKYLAQIMWEWDQESQIYTGYMDGMEKGLADGRAKGLKEGRAKGRAEGLIEGRAEGMARIIDTAKAMKAHGISEEIIEQCTGLSLEEIYEL